MGETVVALMRGYVLYAGYVNWVNKKHLKPTNRVHAPTALFSKFKQTMYNWHCTSSMEESKISKLKRLKELYKQDHISNFSKDRFFNLTVVGILDAWSYYSKICMTGLHLLNVLAVSSNLVIRHTVFILHSSIAMRYEKNRYIFVSFTTNSCSLFYNVLFFSGENVYNFGKTRIMRVSPWNHGIDFIILY